MFGARRHDVGAARELLDELLPNHPRVGVVLGDRGFRGLEGPVLRVHDVTVEIKHRDRLGVEFKPIRPLWRVEDFFAELGRWRRLARSFEATPRSAAAWVQVAAIGWMLSMLCVGHQVAAVRVPRTVPCVISSRRKAPKYGPGHLLVDGTDDVIVRKASFSFNPGRRQERLLLDLLAVCCETYNAGLEERREAWKHSRAKITVFDQFNQLTWLRSQRPDCFAFGLQPIRGTLRRLDEAYGAFLRRATAGETPGFPRFRSQARFDTVYWAEPTSWKVELGPAADPNGATLYMQGVGTIRLPKGARRQLARFGDRGGKPATLTVTRKRAGKGWVWRATVCFTGVQAAKADRDTSGASRLVGVDRGVVVTAAASDGELLTMPPVWVAARDEIAELQRERATKKKYSRQWCVLNRRISRLYGKAARVADNWARETARRIVDNSDVVVLEDLRLDNMTRSAKGTVEEPGTNVAAKRALNKKMSEAALGRLRARINTRAEEAGCRIWVVAAHHTSQQCAACGHVSKENRTTQARFCCVECGHTDHADTNAAVNIAARGAAAEAAWREAGTPPLPRPKARLRRRKEPAAVPLVA